VSPATLATASTHSEEDIRSDIDHRPDGGPSVLFLPSVVNDLVDAEPDVIDFLDRAFRRSGTPALPGVAESLPVADVPNLGRNRFIRTQVVESTRTRGEFSESYRLLWQRTDSFLVCAVENLAIAPELEDELDVHELRMALHAGAGESVPWQNVHDALTVRLGQEVLQQKRSGSAIG
jgi:hypothetical protein